MHHPYIHYISDEYQIMDGHKTPGKYQWIGGVTVNLLISSVQCVFHLVDTMNFAICFTKNN